MMDGVKRIVLPHSSSFNAVLRKMACGLYLAQQVRPPESVK